MPVLFVDPLDLWLMLLGTSLLVVAYWVYHNYVSGRPEDYKRSVNRNLAFFFLLLGLYAFITGLWATFTGLSQVLIHGLYSGLQCYF